MEGPSEIPLRASGRPGRTIRLPKRYQDELPPPPPIPLPDPIDPVVEEEVYEAVIPTLDTTIENPEVFRTDPDGYGIIREYLHGKPTITPDKHYSLSDVSDSPYSTVDSGDLQPRNPVFPSPIQTFYQSLSAIKSFFAPFRNASIYHLMNWFYDSSNTKSMTELNTLVKNVILAPDFKLEDFVGFSAQKEHLVMDSYQELLNESDPSLAAFDDTWIKGTVKISLPCDGFKQSEADAPKFSVDVYYRKLLDVIKAAFAEPMAEKFHSFPFKEFWKPNVNEPEEQLYSELYTGDCWYEEFVKVHATNKQGLHHDLEVLIVALMIWSDSTSLAQFGNA